MKLHQLDIEYFRSIKNCSIQFDEITAIVGENNSGKTAILRALNSFFNFKDEERDFINGTHQYTARTVTKIRITFSEIPDGIYDEIKDADGFLRVLFTYTYGKSRMGPRYYHESADSGKELLDNGIISKIKNNIDFVYIPANRGNEDIEWNEKSVFTQLITRYLENYTKNRDTLSNTAKHSGEKVRDQVLKRLSNDLSNLNMFDDIGNYKIDFTEQLDYTIFLNKLGLEMVSPTMTLPVSEYGSGVKSLTVIALHRVLAALNNTSIVLGLEEPETNLHPQAQRLLINSIKSYRQSCETQAVLTTHSTVIVDALNHNDIVLVRKERDSRRGFHTSSKQLKSTFWEDHGLQELKYDNYFRYRNSDFFFAKYVVLTESPTDSQIVEHMLKNELGTKFYYINIVSIDGIANLQYPYYLLKDLGIPFSAIVDRDLFTEYKNGSLDNSRDPETSLPMYKNIASVNNRVVRDIFNSEEKRNELTTYLNESYTKFFNYVKQYDILPMQYCLEMDLICSSAARELYYNHYNLEEDRNIHKLLIDMKDSIKKATVLVPIFKDLQKKDRPISYKKIKTELINRITNV